MMAAALTVTAMTLGELLGPAAGAHAATAVTDLVLDSREVRRGAAFVAVQGGREHGLRHAADAVAAGAAVVLYEPEGAPDAAVAESAAGVAVPGLKDRLGELARKFYGRGLIAQQLCGITGTNGKTTVAYLVAQAMTMRGEACGYTGTLGYGVPPRLTTHALTTPDTFTLHRELVSLATARVAMEVSSHALAQDRIAGLRFETAAITNLSRDHLDEHGDIERYGRAKARLFALDGLRDAVLNVNDAFAASLERHLPAGVEAVRVAVRGGDARVYGSEADIEAAVRPLGLAGLDIRVTGRYGEATISSPLVGDFNAENLLVALGVLVAWRVPLVDACEALTACEAAPGRFEVHGGGGGRPWIVIDYAHTPAGLERVLNVLEDTAAGDVWCVFGCGGDRDRGKRPLMGAAAARRAQHVVLTDDNPRSEDPARIVDEILAGIEGHSNVVVEHDRGAAITGAVQNAKAGDVVLIAGKGHETTQSKGGERRPFSDRAVALEALGARP